RVLEADRTGPRWGFDIECTGDDAVRVDMSTVLSTGFQQIDPQAVELELAIELEPAFGREGAGVARQQLRQSGEGGIAPGQVVERGIAGVAGVAVILRPAAPGLVIARQAADRMSKLAQQRLVAKIGLV